MGKMGNDKKCPWRTGSDESVTMNELQGGDSVRPCGEWVSDHHETGCSDRLPRACGGVLGQGPGSLCWRWSKVTSNRDGNFVHHPCKGSRGLRKAKLTNATGTKSPWRGRFCRYLPSPDRKQLVLRGNHVENHYERTS